eukprot:8258137-Alexandrium_andersonii.AAC.1
MEAFYDAWEREPHSPFVEQIIREGFPPASMLDPRSTPDVARYFAETGNKFNKKGANCSHLEMYELSDEMAAAIDEEERTYCKRKADELATLGDGCADAGERKRSQAGDQTRQLHVVLRRFPDTIT